METEPENSSIIKRLRKCFTDTNLQSVVPNSGQAQGTVPTKAISHRDRGVDVMDFIPFYSRYKELAIKETRTITTMITQLGLPPGEYGLLENYCTDKTCDCRKVMINVVEAKSPQQFLATIGYGWESAEFYTRWIGGDEKLGNIMAGAYLEPGGIQTKYAPQLFNMFKEVALTDDYVERLKRHYAMFKSYNPSPRPKRKTRRKTRKR